ncbi:MAG: hypothetical protein RR806_05060 [Oscillospiraceae bacterium]
MLKKGAEYKILYETKLADGDSVTYETDMNLEELKSYIVAQNFIEIPRNSTVPYGNGGWRSVPTLASYQTKSIVYINRDIALEECREYNNEIVKRTKPIVDKIFEYEFNKKMKRWLLWDIGGKKTKDDFYLFNEKYLLKVLNKCKHYKCKLM